MMAELRNVAAEENYKELIKCFHQMWDTFPGLARLITSEHNVLAANITAADAGFMPGAICAGVGKAEIHRECKLNEMFRTGKAKTDNVIPNRIRGWMPVPGYDSVCVHFTVTIPKVKE